MMTLRVLRVFGENATHVYQREEDELAKNCEGSEGSDLNHVKELQDHSKSDWRSDHDHLLKK